MPNVSLGPHFEQFVAKQIDDGRFQNASEVVRAGLRLLEDQEVSRAERRARLAQGVQNAFDESAPDLTLASVFEQIEERAEADRLASTRDP